MESTPSNPKSALPTPPNRRRWGLMCIAPLVVIISVIGFVSWYFPTYYIPRPVPANPYFGAAVTFAFGEGLQDPQLPAQSKIAGFLNHSNPGTLRYEDLPHPIPAGPMSSFQQQHYYLMMLVGAFWRVFGVSWSALGPLIALMAGISGVCIYGVLRTRVRPVIAAIGALAILAYPSHLALMHYIRDYAKTPVFFLTFFLVSILLTRTLSAAKLLLLGIALGVATGIGAGIRQDIQVIWVVIPLLYLFCLPTGIKGRALARIASLCLAVGVFLLLSAPATTRNRHHITSHLLIMGLFKYNHDSMGFGGAPYIWYNESLMTDNYVNTIIQDFNRRSVGQRVDVTYASQEYDRAGIALLKTIAQHFPADLFTRFLAASITTIRDAPWLIVGALPTMYDISDPAIQKLQGWQRGIRTFWNSYGLAVVLTLLTVMSWHSLRLALATTGLLLFFTGYSSLQFQPRHFWHLGIIFGCAATFALEELIRIVVIVCKGTASIRAACARMLEPRRVKGVIAYILIVSIGLVATLGGLRAYQRHTMTGLFARYRAASLAPATITSIEPSAGGGRTIHATPAPFSGPTDLRLRYDVSYLAVRFEGAGPLPTYLNLLNNNFSPINVRELAGSQRNGPATVYLPWFLSSSGISIDLRGVDPDAPITISSITNPDDFPIPMVLVLPDDASSLTTHNSITTQKRAGM